MPDLNKPVINSPVIIIYFCIFVVASINNWLKNFTGFSLNWTEASPNREVITVPNQQQWEAGKKFPGTGNFTERFCTLQAQQNANTIVSKTN
jgi:hypothetical protein